LQIPRTGHSATVLPDGTVLFAGGVGADGQVVQQAEIFNPATGALQLLDPGSPTPRGFHSATLLTDGRVLLAGGVAANGQVLDTAELWDSQRTSAAATVECS
jgi:Galactose oxidase, central domain